MYEVILCIDPNNSPDKSFNHNQKCLSRWFLYYQLPFHTFETIEKWVRINK